MAARVSENSGKVLVSIDLPRHSRHNDPVLCPNSKQGTGPATEREVCHTP